MLADHTMPPNLVTDELETREAYRQTSWPKKYALNPPTGRHRDYGFVHPSFARIQWRVQVHVRENRRLESRG